MLERGCKSIDVVFDCVLLSSAFTLKRKSGLFGRTELSGTRWTESSPSGLDLAVDMTQGFKAERVGNK